MGTQVTVTALPSCDFCAQAGDTTPATYDARTVYGPWANMCERHWRIYTNRQLGTGHGQKLVLAEQEDRS